MKGVTQVFYGTTEEWAAQELPLYKGVWGVEVQTDGSRVIKIGDGVRSWPLLPPFIDGDSQLGDLTALIDQEGIYLSQVQELQQQITEAQTALAGQLQQFESGKAELEAEIAAAGLVDNVSVRRNEAGKLYSSGTAEVTTDTYTSAMSNAPEDHGAHMRMTDTELGIGAGFGVNTNEGFAAGLMYITDLSDGPSNAALIMARDGDGKNRFYLLKDKAIPETAEGLDPNDELLNKAEILELIAGDQA
ncbi:MAG: hypothetical protein LBC31_06945 [Treponema sp.]|jgi:hypothetical protein|nr:hypothetical protein [Treponema sp.]